MASATSAHLPAHHGIDPRAWLAAVWGIFRGARGRWWQVAAWVVVALIVLRLAAPMIITVLVNRALSRPGEVQGSVDRVSLGILTGNYDIYGVHLTVADKSRDGDQGKAPGQVPRAPLLDLDHLGCSIFWGPLLRGRLEGTVLLQHPVFHLGPPAAEQASEQAPKAAEQMKPENWRGEVDRLIRFRIATIEVRDGGIMYVDPKKGVQAQVGSIKGRVDDLIVPAGSNRPATFSFVANTVGDGHLAVFGQGLFAQDKPTVDVRAELERVDLPKLNPIVSHYDGLEFRSGRFSAYVDLHLAGDRITGFAKPIIKDLDVTSYKAKNGSAGTKLFWKAVVPVAEWVLENEDKSQHAARIPIEGTVKDPQTDLWTVVGTALSNAFVRAIVPGFDPFH